MELLLAVWDWAEPAQNFILAVLLSLVTATVLGIFRAKVSLIWGSTSSNYHQFQLEKGGNQISIWTEKFYVQNMGRKAASDIEIVFNVAPTSYNIWPPREHGEVFLKNGNFAIKVPSPAPGELPIVDMIDIDLKNPKILSVNCPDTLSKSVEFAPTRQSGNLFNATLVSLMVIGFVSILYLALSLVF